MLVIHKEQMVVFEENAVQAFEDRTYAHLLEYFPRHCELLGEKQMRRVIRHGWEKAKSYNLLAECCVRSYIDLMCVLGGEFDTDPLLPWAAGILRAETIEGDVVRGDQLYTRAWEYIGHIALDYRDAAGNPTTTRFVNELRWIRQASDSSLTSATWSAFAESLQARLVAAFPAKCAYVGAENVARTIKHGTAQAERYEITSERGVTLVTALRFVLGAGFDTDPLLPWAASCLNDATLPSQHKRTDRLFAEGVSFLKRWWESAPDLEG